MSKAGFAVELLETRHACDAFEAMPVKTDREDACGIKSLPAQRVRVMLPACKLVQAKLHDVEMSLRGILRGFGLQIGRTMPHAFEGRVRELVEGHPALTAIADALLAAMSVLHQEFQVFERKMRSLARRDDRAKLLMSAAGVGVLVSLTFASAIDDPERFRRSKQVSGHFGMTPKHHQSGESMKRAHRPGWPDGVGGRCEANAAGPQCYMTTGKPRPSSVRSGWRA